MSTTDTEIAILGAGLSGLAVAEALAGRGIDQRLLEARERVGGRVLSEAGEGGHGPRYDLGPAWLWPQNTRMLRLVSRLGIPLFEQHAAGRLVFEDHTGAVRRDLDMVPMAGSLRVAGGLARVADALAAALPDGTLALGHRIERIEAEGDHLCLSGTGPEGPVTLRARQVVLALPPRLVAERISFTPTLPAQRCAQLAAVPTWMAGQAKLVAVYDDAFWRAAGLSGDAISHRGPLAEIHDATAGPNPEGEAALFGFVHPSWLARGREAALRRAAVAQLAALFGAQAAEPRALLLKDWSADSLTATDADRGAPTGHPAYRPILLGDAPWVGRLHLAGSETARENGGFLEGALEAAEQALAHLGIPTPA